jgi:rubredoxin
MVKFKCHRCGVEHVDELEKYDKHPESYGYLHNLNLPKGWDDMLNVWLLCPDCAAKHKAFMNGEAVEGVNQWQENTDE